MGKIQVLPPELISKIAAGEVVERPASVIKELVENSIDAGSRNISVEVDLGGIALIRITDDGSGMSREDAQLSIESHATSKINKFEDIYALGTLGFRGEALASIAAVSQFSLVTRLASDLSGTEISRGLADWQISDAGCNVGTQVTVKNLFYNVPARRKFLRSAATEYQHTVELMESFGLLLPSVAFKLIANGRTVFDWPAGEWASRCKSVLGQIFKEFMSVEYEGEFKLSGYLGKPVIARPKRLQYLFINNRTVTDFMFSRAVKEAYGNLIAKECYPVFVLKAGLSPAKIDVNVHPRKTEVKIADSHVFYREVLRLVKEAIDPVPQYIKTEMASPILAAQSTPLTAPLPPFVSPDLTQPKFSGSQSSWTPLGKLFKQQSNESLKFYDRLNEETQKFTILGHLSLSYIIAQVKDSVIIFDQHAVSERLRYEEIKRGSANSSQVLMHPMSVELSMSEFMTWQECQAGLAAIGWQIEPFGDRTLLVRSVPAAVREVQARNLLTLLLTDMSGSKSSDDLWKSMACHTAVRVGDDLTIEEQKELVRRALAENVQSCPHGRPVMYKIELEELHKIFKRRGF